MKGKTDSICLLGTNLLNLPNQEVTILLQDLRKGDEGAAAKLLPLVYNELRRLASVLLKDQNPNITLLTTDLVHESFLKLAGTENQSWQDRSHFFRVAATAMRQILIDEARKRASRKRGGGLKKVQLDEEIILTDETAEQLIALDEALQRLTLFDERLGRIVELRFFAGLTIEETAAAISLSPATVKREWTAARTWLYRELTQQESKS